MSSRVFKITKRHYDTITKQAIDNLPQEVGGFLGGKEDVIQAILPMFNKHLFNKTDTFARKVFQLPEIDFSFDLFSVDNLLLNLYEYR